uniref:Uncharacterized protein n=1 Tax=Lepeophtheirus salmonis TaxID=72036 RepID=A0A0K2UYK5_LEPSM
MTHQFDVLASEKGVGLSQCVRARIVIVNNDPSSLVRFSNFSEDFRQTNCDVPLIIDRPMMLKWNSRHMTNFAGETGDHLLQSASFVGFGLSSNTYMVVCCSVSDSSA